MIHLCTCTGGSASTISSSKRRGGTVSCKNCGGRPAIDGKSSSSCLLSTVLELTSLINSDFTWTKVSKGCRSSSRKPRRSNTINLASGELLTKDSKGLEMPVSESEKLGVSVLGCHFSEKAEHIPIKKRRFLFRASSPPRNTPIPSLEGAERYATSPKASSHGLQLNSNTTCLPAESEAVAGMCQRGSNDKDETELVKASKEAGEDDDFSGISILAAAACSNSLGAEADRCEGSGIISSVTKSPQALSMVELKENNAKSANICNEESDSHTSTTPSKGVVSSTKDHSSPDKFTLDNSSPDESKLDNSFSQAPLGSAFSKMNQEASMIQKSSARDVRLNWDLNTVMDAWEEPFVSEHEISASGAAHDVVTFVEEKSNNCMKDNSGDCELGSERECGSASKTISNLFLPVELKSLAHENELKLGNHKPDGYDEISEPLSHGPDSAAQHAVVKEPESLHNKHKDSATDAIPVTRTLTLENPTHGIFAKWVNISGQSSGGLGRTEAVDTELSMDCSIPPGFDHCLNLRAPKESVGVSSAIVGAGNNINFPTTTTQTVMTVTSRSEYDRGDLSLTTAVSLENTADQSGVASNKVDDEAKMKMELTSNVVGMGDLVNKGTDLPQETDKGGSKGVNQTTIGALLVAHSPVVVEDQPADISSMHDAEVPLDNGFGYDNSQSDNRGGSGIDKLDELSVGYDSQYEDGELRESSIHAWKGYEGNEGENEYDMDNMGDGFNLGIVDAQETSSQCGQEGSSRIKSTDVVGPGREADLISSVLLPEKLQSSDEVSGSGPNEMINGQGNGERQDVVQHASQSDEWKMNVSGWDLLPENHRISSNNFTKTRNFSSRKFSYREQKDGFETEDLEAKAEGSRFYRKESLTHIGGPSTRDMFLSRGRFRMQGCSSKAADGLTSRPERESGTLRSFGRGRYSPRSRASGRGGGMWNRSPERGRDLKRLPSPSYQGPSFLRSMLEDVGSVDNMTNEGNMDPSDAGRPNTSSYISRRSFRSRSPMNREENDFRARLGLRPTGDTTHDRFVNMGRGRGRGRSVRYGSRPDGGGPRGRYLGPPSDDCDEFLTEYTHPFPRRRRGFSPVERRGNHSFAHHHSDSRSPSRPRTRSPIANSGFRRRSRSPNFRPDSRMRRPRSPNYRRGFEADHVIEYNSGPRNNNSSPPSSRWVNYKERPAVFDRRSPPPGRTDAPQGERFSFYDSSRKPKQNEYYRSGHPGRFSDLNEAGRGRPRYVGNDGDRPSNGYRRGGFVRRYNMEGPAKRFQYEDEDGFGRGYDARDKHALELHARGNPKPCSNGTDSRFRDFPRRLREDRDTVAGDFKRRSREVKDPCINERESKEESEHIVDDFQRRPIEVNDQPTNLDSTPNEVVKEGDKPMLGSN